MSYLIHISQSKQELKMKPLALLRPQTIITPHSISSLKNPRFRVSCSSLRPEATEATASKTQYKAAILDDFLLNSFRKKLVHEVGWDSEKPGYDGMIELAKALTLKGKTKSDSTEAAVRILVSLFPPFLLDLYKTLITPINGGKVAAMMVARVTAYTCRWLMGPCLVNSVDLPDGSSCSSGVFVERCRYLEESKCVGVCVKTCKLPTQTFFKDYMGIPLVMEPNFSDYSCQFKFGVLPPLPEEDAALREPCLDICPIATRRREIISNTNTAIQCPKL